MLSKKVRGSGSGLPFSMRVHHERSRGNFKSVRRMLGISNKLLNGHDRNKKKSLEHNQKFSRQKTFDEDDLSIWKISKLVAWRRNFQHKETDGLIRSVYHLCDCKSTFEIHAY